MRVHGFDILRGLCAIAVAISHVCLLQNIANPGIAGITSVLVFFALSGASMYIAYADRLHNGLSYPNFIGLRIFRLAPLFWLLLLLNGRAFGSHFYNTLLNASFLFSFGMAKNPTILMGSWSLGIEFMFYLVFPLMLIFVTKKLAPAFFLFSIVMQHYYTGDVYLRESLLEFIALFFGGCMIGKWLLHPFRLNPWLALPLFTIAMLNLIFICAHGDQAMLTGFSGDFMTIQVLLVVYLAAQLKIPLRAIWVAAFLGDMSYGLYLLHPYIYHRLHLNDPSLMVISTLTVSIMIALISERFYEKPIRKFGYRLLKIH